MKTVTLGGRPFAAIGESTMEHDVVYCGALARAGLQPVPGIEEGEDPQDYCDRITGLVMGSGELFNLLGAMLIPAETTSEKWTPTIAAETAEHLKGLTDPEEKLKVRAQIASLIFDFFRVGIASSLTSLTSSKTTATPGDESDPDLAPSSTPPINGTGTGAHLSAN